MESLLIVSSLFSRKRIICEMRSRLYFQQRVTRKWWDIYSLWSKNKGLQWKCTSPPTKLL